MSHIWSRGEVWTHKVKYTLLSATDLFRALTGIPQIYTLFLDILKSSDSMIALSTTIILAIAQRRQRKPPRKLIRRQLLICHRLFVLGCCDIISTAFEPLLLTVFHVAPPLHRC